ncbi:hypothetical protein CSB45_09490 [candidate division KSB3 bacterium]|uniref:Uncharacterized protein n=1 Tax=candidate division KSB3 bacterium TaxID=2044937 RepID=A0A2G6E527_9BACT|nr:MAG: hypothetical protein CSB45_09490 [candidate division KSB3 bacterium]PIE29443.1 MAG: hypothetical protein CSA57_08585 [candidate division KSB3 bacterium]
MIIMDNTVLSNFAVVHRPEWIRHAFRGPIGTTEQVFDELTTGIELGRLPECSWTWLKCIRMTQSEAVQCTQLRQQLDEGEASCLAVAHIGHGRSQQMIKMLERGPFASIFPIQEHLASWGCLSHRSR